MFDLHICSLSNESLLSCFYLPESLCYTFFCAFFLYILHFYNWFIFKTSYTFSEGKGHIHTLNKMIVKYLCSVCSGALTKNTKQYSVIVLIGWFILLVTI